MKTLLILCLLMNVDKLQRTVHCIEIQDQVLSITPNTEEQVDIVKKVSTQYETALWQPYSPQYIKEEAEVHLYVPATSSETVKDLLQKHAITHEVLVANAKELIELQMRSVSSDARSGSTFYESFHSLDDIYQWINMTQEDNPTMVQRILIGHSTEKRPLYVMKLSLNDKPNKKAIWMDCGIHAREWISPAFCLWFVQHSLSMYSNDQNITHILDNMDVYVLPVMNPDGYQYTWTTNRSWRKNRSVNKSSNCLGVDLNRNFDANWCTKGASHNPCADTYCGAFPESEPESQAVANFLRSHKDSVQLYLAIHSYSQMLLFPYSYTYDHTENHKDLLEMAQEAAQNIKRYSNNTYIYGAGAQTIYLAPGGSDDWAYDLGIKYSFTFELQDRGRYGFLLPPSLIPQACNEALTAVKTIALKVIEKTQAPTSPIWDQVLSITPNTEEQVDIVKKVSTQYETALWQPDSPQYIKEEAEVHLYVPATSSETVKDLLQKHAITHEVFLANAKELIELQMRSVSTDARSGSTFYESFHSLDDIYQWINMTQEDNPTTVQRILIGHSTEKRPLYVMKLSLNDKPNKKAIWMDCGIHAREWISPAFCLWFVQHSLSMYKNDQDITQILDNMDVYVLPVMNPDGYQYTWTTNRMWRKNRSVNNSSDCPGVDLNRNFEANWCTGGASDNPCTETYCGAFPESEPESQAVANFLRSHKDSVQLYLSIHSYSQLLLFPYSGSFNHAENHKDLVEVAQEAAQNIKRYSNNTYGYGPGAETIYLCTGASKDWAYDLGIKYTFTFELQDRGRYGFLLPPSHIPQACNEALTGVKTIALKVIEKTQVPPETA